MLAKTIIQEIERLPLSKRFWVVEQALKSIKKEELKHQMESATNSLYNDYSNEKDTTAFSHLVSEKSLAKDWLSEEDNRWDKLL